KPAVAVQARAEQREARRSFRLVQAVARRAADETRAGELRPRGIARKEDRPGEDVAAEHEASVVRDVQCLRAGRVHRQPSEQAAGAIDRAVPEELLEGVAAVG